MSKGISRLLLAGITICFFISTAFAQSPAIDKGVSWLSSVQNADKSWGTAPFPLVIPLQATTETVLALRNIDSVSQPYNDGVAWLSGQTIDNVGLLANRIVARASSALDNSGDLNTILSVRNAEGLWGTDEENQSNEILDTALALQALKSANYPDLSIINPALAYLTNSQNPDGGWGFVQGDDSNVYMTAVVSSTLQLFPQTTTIATTINKATAFLISHQNADGGFGSSPSTVYETALAYSALIAISTDATVLGNAINYLTTTQAIDGSWNQDPYSTALALKALYLSENRPTPPPLPPTTGTVMGAVVASATNQPLSGVVVTLVSDPSLTTTTDTSGAFTLNNIPQGSQQITLTTAGYAPLTLTTKVTAGSFFNVGKVGLSVNPTSGIIMGTIWDADANAPFPGVTVMVVGTLYMSLTATDGTYTITGVPPGTWTVSTPWLSKPNYYSAPFTGTLAPGGILIYSPALSTNPPPGGLRGTVIDATTNLPIQGARVTLSPPPPGIEPSVTTNASGAFSLSGVAVGSYKATVEAAGYGVQTFTVGITARGETTVTVPLLLQATTTTITGKVTDASGGGPIAGAEVTIPGTDKSTLTDTDGNYSLSGITEMTLTIKASAAGYDSKVYSFTLDAYGDYEVPFALAKSGMSTTRIFGAVWDEATNSPISGAEVSILGTSKSALTGPDGEYSLAGVTDMVMSLKASAAGYDSNFYPLTLDAYGDYEVFFALTKSRVSTVAITSLSTDKTGYNANDSVAIVSEIENNGDAAAEITADAQIADQYGNVLGLVSLPGDPIAVSPHAVQMVSLQWNAGQNPPGPYQITLSLVDHALGGLLAEGKTDITISPTANVDRLVSLISPKFVNVRATATIGITAYLVNRSNVDAALSAQYEIKDPDGTMIKDGTVDFSLLASEAFKTIPLTDFTNTFVKSGQYPVTVKIFSGAALLAQTADAIYVAPSIRIDPANSLEPATVVPDGDKDIRINIQIKGVEELQ